MAVQKLVFASKSERLNYYKVRRQWGKDYNLYPNLPFLMVFNTKDLFDLSTWEFKRIELTKIEWSRLKKTSITSTLWCGPSVIRSSRCSWTKRSSNSRCRPGSFSSS